MSTTKLDPRSSNTDQDGIHPQSIVWAAHIDPSRAITAIRRTAQELRSITDASLGDLTEGLRERVAAGRVDTQEVTRLAFAATVEAVRRVMGMELYDVQLLAGLALARGHICEMQTGEGKTISAIAPAVARAVAGDSVHVATVNEYLAARDFDQVLPVFELLGIRVGLLRSDATSFDKRSAYQCDVTYGAGYEFGFDYLRDQLTRLAGPIPVLGQRLRWDLAGKNTSFSADVQDRREFSMIDEADSVLLDEAHVPLVISSGGNSNASVAEAEPYRSADRLVADFVLGNDFHVESARRTVSLTQQGWERAHSYWRAHRDLRLQRVWQVYVENALYARHILRRDVDYIVADGKIQIVDVNTGRVFSDRTWRDGLHQAVQVRESVCVTVEQGSVAQISRQRFGRLYRQLSGMTGTAQGTQREFRSIYRLPVVPIPLRRPCRRVVEMPQFFPTRELKWQGIALDVARRHATGQPVLIGTRSIEHSEAVAATLRAHGLPCVLLNGRQDRDEADIVAEAGRAGSITVATNMAGRGTDIRLGEGRPKECGLHVVGEECHDLYRVDRQLMGRAARQGDPGSCQFFISAEDSLLVDHAPWLVRRIRRHPHGSPQAQRALSRMVRRAQDQCAQRQYQQRRDLLRQDRWLEALMDKLAKDLT